MSFSPNATWKVVGALVGVLIVGGLIGWLTGGRGSNPTSQSSPAVEGGSNVLASMPLVASGRTNRAAGLSIPPPEASSLPLAADPATNVLIADWEERIDDILRSTDEDRDKSAKLLAMYPNLPLDGQTEAAGHLVNLVPDDDFSKLGQILTDPKTDEAVQEVIMFDLLNRPNAVKLPLLLEMARNPRHAMAAESRDLLELYVEQDFGEDWAAWQQATEKYLRDNPD